MAKCEECGVELTPENTYCPDVCNDCMDEAEEAEEARMMDESL
jgi:uncharacterized OB-fold protein